MKLLPITITGKVLDTSQVPSISVEGDKAIDALSIVVPVSYEGTSFNQEAWHIRFKLPGGTVHIDPLVDGVPDSAEAPTTITFTYPMQGLIVSQSGNVALQIINIPADGPSIFQTLPGPYLTVSSTLTGPPSADYNSAPWGTYLAQYEAIRDEAKGYRDQAQQIASEIHDEYVILDEKKVDKVLGKGLSTEDYTTAEKSKLAGIESGAQVNAVTSVAGKTGAVSLTKDDVGLSLVNNTPDSQKPVSEAQQIALDSLDGRLANVESAVDYLSDRTVKIYGAAFGVTSDTEERLFDAIGLTSRRANGSVNSEKSDFLSVGPWARMNKVLFDNLMNIKAEMGDTLFNAFRATDTLNEGTKFEKFYSFDNEVTIGGIRKRVMLVSTSNVKHIYLGENDGSPVYVDLTCEPRFIREDGTERPYTIISSCHTGRDSSGTLFFGKPGVFPEVNRSIVSFDTLYPDGMYGYHFTSSSILEKLLSIEFCSLKSQTVVGAGINSGMPYGSGDEFKCTVSQTGSNSIIIANAGATNMRVGMVMQIGSGYTSQSVAANRTITAIEDYDASNKRITVDGAAFDSVLGTTTIVSWGQPVPKEQLESMGLDCGWISQFDSENRSHVFAYGIADVWGNVWSFERGKMRVDGRWYFCYHPALCKSVSNPVGADGWVDSEIVFYTTGNGYLKEVQFFVHEGKSTWFPKEIGASSATFYADYCAYFYSDYSGIRVVIRFGGWHYGSGDGLWYVNGYYTPSNASINGSDRGILDAA